MSSSSMMPPILIWSPPTVHTIPILGIAAGNITGNVDGAFANQS